MQVTTILIIIACLLSNPSVCREEKVVNLDTPFYSTCGNIQANMLEKWKKEHPNLSVSDWSCKQQKFWNL